MSRARHLADAPTAPQLIESYGDGGFRVSGAAYRGSIIILPDRTEGWHVADISALTAQDLARVCGAEPPVEILLLGCGARTVGVPESLRAKLKKHGIVVEPMSTGAACRTYNLLIAEGRPVAGAIVAVE